jgi:hypothetical protein
MLLTVLGTALEGRDIERPEQPHDHHAHLLAGLDHLLDRLFGRPDARTHQITITSASGAPT